jgi:type III pantothenate kinase
VLLAIDVGNTNIVFALFEGDKVMGQWRLSTDSKRTSDEYAILFKELMSLKGLRFDHVDNVIISSVVPQNLFSLKTLAKEFLKCEPLIIGEQGVNVGIDIQLDRPAEVGADRIVNALAAYDGYKKASIVIDFGTATTFDVVTDEGVYIGGVIAPGINLSIEALHKAAAKLPEVEIKRPEKVIGTNTLTAMQSGVFFGYLSLIEGIVARIKNEQKSDMLVIATGGLAPLFSESTEVIDHLEQNLTINGLLKIFKLNN